MSGYSVIATESVHVLPLFLSGSAEKNVVKHFPSITAKKRNGTEAKKTSLKFLCTCFEVVGNSQSLAKRIAGAGNTCVTLSVGASNRLNGIFTRA